MGKNRVAPERRRRKLLPDDPRLLSVRKPDEEKICTKSGQGGGMADLLPSTSDLTRAPDAEPRVIGVDSDEADDMLSALSSDTARRMLQAFHDEPATPSKMADRLGTSLQNVQYHLGKLEAAKLVTVVDTVYSEKGREMNVYAPSDRPLVVYAGQEKDTFGLKQALSRLLGGVAILGVFSLLVQAWLGDLPFPFGTGAGESGGDGGTMSTAETAGAVESAAGLPPGLLFFLGGLLVLASVGAVWYWNQR